MMIKARQCINRKALMTLYYSFFYPYLTYCNQVWVSTHDTHITTLYLIQKKLYELRVVLTVRNQQTHFSQSWKLWNFLSLNLLLTSRFMFRLNRREVPDIFPNFFTRNTDVHGYSMRQHYHLDVLCERSKLWQFSIRNRGTILWNSILQLDINPDTSEAVFVKMIKHA